MRKARSQGRVGGHREGLLPNKLTSKAEVIVADYKSRPIRPLTRLSNWESALAKVARKFFLFELRSVPLDLFHKGGPDSLNEPNLIRGHGQKPLGRIDPALKECPYCSITEPTIFKRRLLHDAAPTT